MQTVFLGTCWDSVKSIDILKKSGYNIDKEYKGIIPLNLLLPEEQTVFNGLLSLLDLEYEKDVTNAGLAIFDEDWQYIYFTYPCVGLGAKDELGLMIGADNDQHKSAFLPMVFTPAKNPDDAGEYHIVTPKGKKIKVALTSIPGSDNRTRHYLLIKNKHFIFNIPFKASADDLSVAFVNESFDYGTFDECCKHFFKSGVKFSNMFKKAFTEKTFPNEGVVLVISKGKISQSEEYGASSIWQIIGCSHPDMIVLDANKNNPGEMPLSEAGTIFCSKACTATSHLLAGKSGEEPFILHAREPNKNLNHLPIHSGYSIGNVSPRFKQRFPEMFEKAKILAAGNLSYTMKQMSSAASVDDPALEDF
ncbi:hypothetical protein ELBI_60 [Anabaena phage Elbi]|nr:hypothetical protein ELBI_60 [Anabaena phage Elbi]